MSNENKAAAKSHGTKHPPVMTTGQIKPDVLDTFEMYCIHHFTISEGTEERVSNSSISRDLCGSTSFFPNAWEQISIQSLLLGPRVKVRNGKSENEVSLHFFRRRGKNDEGVGMKLA